MAYGTEITTLVFDWGGTLMLEDWRYAGSMVDWPEVQAVSGVHEGLQSLVSKFRLVIGTNATASNAAQARKALARVGLDSFFTDIFTFSEIKARKPEPDFFRGIEEALGVRPQQLLMIGNDFWADVVGACTAGWKAVWYNPAGRACPGLNPLHQAELSRMEDLPAALERIYLPDPQTCCLWCLEQGFPYNLWQHVQLVAAIAYQLAEWLREKGEPIDPILAHRGGLLHDLAKISARQIGTKASHGEVGASLLRERNQPELAEIARRHLIYTVLEKENAPRTWEEKLVYFADKLTEGGRLVQVEERLQALSQRYKVEPAKMDQVLPLIMALQAEIDSACGLEPGSLVKHLSESLNGLV